MIEKNQTKSSAPATLVRISKIFKIIFELIYNFKLLN